MPGRRACAVGVLAATVFLVAGFARAAEWSRYLNARYAYGVDVPPSFSAVEEADNSDGGTSRSAAGNAVLSVWGAHLIDGPFVADIDARMASDLKEGWSVTYRAISKSRASWSSVNGARIRYTRAIPQCRAQDQAAYVQIEYDASAKVAFDPVVARIARSLKGLARC